MWGDALRQDQALYNPALTDFFGSNTTALDLDGYDRPYGSLVGTGFATPPPLTHSMFHDLSIGPFSNLEGTSQRGSAFDELGDNTSLNSGNPHFSY